MVRAIQKKLGNTPLNQAEQKGLNKTNRLLMMYQWENMCKFMTLNFNGANLPTINIGNFRAVLKQTLIHIFTTSLDGSAFSFEIVFALPNTKQSYFWESFRSIPSSKLLDIDLFLRVKYIKEMKFCNDRVKLGKIIHFFPLIEKRAKAGSLHYSDLFEIADCMFKQYQINYSNPDLREKTPATNSISYFIHKGQLPATQSRNSNIRLTSRQYIMNEFPILLYRTAMTCKPMRMLAIMLPSHDTIEFHIYSIESNLCYTKSLSMDEVCETVPFIRQMISQEGFRESIGFRLFTTYKNALLMELFTRELTAANHRMK